MAVEPADVRESLRRTHNEIRGDIDDAGHAPRKVFLHGYRAGLLHAIAELTYFEDNDDESESE